MVAAQISAATIFAVLLVAEALWQNQKLKSELSRKFVHILVGAFVATWPFFMSWGIIQALTVVMLLAIAVSYHFRILGSIHSVRRGMWGELLFPIGIGLTTLVTQNKWIFAAAILHLALADGMAAIIGTKYGSKNKQYSYKVLGEKRSLVGLTAFWLTSTAIMVGVTMLAPANLQYLALPLIFGLPITAAALESVSVRGSDNIAIPLFVAIALNPLPQLF